jgi:hypothetical protein
MDKTTKKRLDAARNSLMNMLKQINELEIPSITSYNDVFDEIRARNEKLANVIQNYLTAAIPRKMAIVHAGTTRDMTTLMSLSVETPPDISVIINALEQEAIAAEKTADPNQMSILKNEQSELQARKNIANRKQDLIKYLEELRLKKKYFNCLEETGFKHITYKAKKIISDSVTDNLRQCLNSELSYFGVTLSLELKASGLEGETIHEIKISNCKLPSGATISDILSEGEEKIVAISAFLAELKACEHKSAIVFDDPVSSLDHRWRGKVAERLVEEAKSRQVIIFTHDIVFAHDLMDDAERSKVPLSIQYVYQVSRIPGYISDRLPWGAGRLKERIDELKRLAAEARKIYDTESGTKYFDLVGNLYSKLRATWERIVEDVAFCKTILRHRDHISVNLEFKKVSVLDLNDCEDLINAHKKCCDVTEAHDPSRGRIQSLPIPADIDKDIDLLESWMQRVRDKQKNVA